MRNLINRADGEIICKIEDQDFLVLSKNLARQSESASGYYLNAEGLKLLCDRGISKRLTRSLHQHMDTGGLDLGWEDETLSSGLVYYGTTSDSLGEPIGGVRIVLLSLEHRVLNWAYSRPDGRYRIACPENVEPRHVRFAGRGDLILTEFVVNEEQDLGNTRIDTLSGKIVTKEGDPVSGVSVQLVKWKEGGESNYRHEGSKGGGLTWGDTDLSGQFVVPIRIEDEDKSWQAVLEILAPKGQTLRKLNVTIRPNESLDLGHLVCPLPEKEWGGEPVQTKRSVVMYPGVSERPLS